jgi:hypothetical protein
MIEAADMNSIYEALRALLRSKELEIKKLEKEIEALRIVLPIVADANQNALETDPSKVPANGSKPGDAKGKPYMGTEIESVLAQVTNSPSGGPERPAGASDTGSKPRSTWP